MKRIWRSCRALSLLEMVMATALTGIIMIPLSGSFSLATQGWESEKNNSELLQHARLAMHRITSELRYASGIGVRSDPNALEFFTGTLIDNGGKAVGIVYKRVPGTGVYALMRGVKTDILTPMSSVDLYPMAGWDQFTGAPINNINVTSFVLRYFKRSGASLVELSSGEPSHLVDFVEVFLRLQHKSDIVALKSRVKLRNR